MASEALDSVLGGTIGHYRVVARLGAGGMCVVYLGEHRRLAKRAAIKVLTTSLRGSLEGRTRLLDEARALSMVEHPNVVQIFDCGELPDGSPYLVLEALSGPTLAEMLAAAGPLRHEVAAACAIVAQVAEAVDAAHARGIVHRDLKPENVVLACVHGVPSFKVIDFGVAKLPASTRTVDGAVVGTPAYMPPEQQGSAAHADVRADVYALGRLLGELLGPEPAHSSELLRELAAMTAADPADRPADVKAAIARLERALGCPSPSWVQALSESRWLAAALGAARSPSTSLIGDGVTSRARETALAKVRPRRRVSWRRCGVSLAVSAVLIAGATIGARWARRPVAPAGTPPAPSIAHERIAVPQRAPVPSAEPTPPTTSHARRRTPGPRRAPASSFVLVGD